MNFLRCSVVMDIDPLTLALSLRERGPDSLSLRERVGVRGSISTTTAA